MPIVTPKFRKGWSVLVKFPDQKDNNFNVSGLMNRYIGDTRKITKVIKHGSHYFYTLKGAISRIDEFEWRFAECDLKHVKEQ